METIRREPVAAIRPEPVDAIRPQPTALTGSRSRTGRGRRVVHVALGVASWIALGALWVWQLHIYVPSDWFGGVELILALGAGWACFSFAWVHWCRSIYRSRHRRTTPLLRPVDFGHDALGRRILAPPGIDQARGQLLVSVSAEDGTKRYELATRRARTQTPQTPPTAHPTRRRRRALA